MEPTDPASLSTWFGQYGGALVLYARQWLSPDQAEDAVQEVFLRLCEPHPPIAGIRNWLFAAVRNTAIDRLRGRRRLADRHARAARGAAAWFEERTEDVLDGRAVQQALERLPAGEREIIVLRVWGGLTFADSAALTGEPISTLSSRYQAGLATLRKQMETSCDPKTI